MRRNTETTRLQDNKTTRRVLFIAFAFAMIVMASCGKMDKNGKLDGNWQMVEWRDNATGNLLKDNSAQLFYTVKLELIQLQDKNSGAMPYLAYFTHKGDSLLLGKVFKKLNNTDSLASYSDLRQYGVSSDGKFFVELLTDEHMVLKNSTNTLKFRKY